MSRISELRVTKRDGSQEPFSLPKLRNCLVAVLRAGDFDPKIAAPLLQAVLAHLDEWRGSRPPTSDYLFRCLRSVLQQTGLGDAAGELAFRRRLRNLHRNRTRVVSPSRSRAMAWQKCAVVQSLRRDYGLNHATARFLAGQVETQAFGLKYAELSTQLIGELVRNEVIAWGLSGASSGASAEVVVEPLAAPQPNKE